jgi:hypothetical protein
LRSNIAAGHTAIDTHGEFHHDWRLGRSQVFHTTRDNCWVAHCHFRFFLPCLPCATPKAAQIHYPPTVHAFPRFWLFTWWQAIFPSWLERNAAKLKRPKMQGAR